MLVLVPVVFPLLDPIDDFILNHPVSPIISIGSTLLLVFYYPSHLGWTTTWADTTIILGVTGGLSVGHWINMQCGVLPAPVTPPPYPIITPDTEWLIHSIVRMLIGATVLLFTRALCKNIIFRSLCRYYKVSTSDKVCQKMPSIQIPQKYVTYMCVAFNAVVVMPYLFRFFNIERVTVFTQA